jgi:hypothetical protein
LLNNGCTTGGDDTVGGVKVLSEGVDTSGIGVPMGVPRGANDSHPSLYRIKNCAIAEKTIPCKIAVTIFPLPPPRNFLPHGGMVNMTPGIRIINNNTICHIPSYFYRIY